MKHIDKFAKLSLALMLAVSLWLAGLHAFTRGVMVNAPQYAGPADAIVVLTGGAKRLETGFDLLDKGMGKKLFVSGVHPGVAQDDLLSRWKRKRASKIKCCVVLGFEADDTLGNAREATAWLRKEGYKTYFLVTSNYHLRRALLAFRSFAPELSPLAWPVEPDGIDMLNWWRDPSSRSLILREYMKYIAGFVRRPFAS